MNLPDLADEVELALLRVLLVKTGVDTALEVSSGSLEPCLLFDLLGGVAGSDFSEVTELVSDCLLDLVLTPKTNHCRCTSKY